MEVRSIGTQFYNYTGFLTGPVTDRQIPTILSYVDGEEYTGNQAKAMLVRNPKNTLISFKDFLGQEYVVLQATSEIKTLTPATDSSLLTLPTATPLLIPKMRTEQSPSQSKIKPRANPLPSP